MKKEPLILVDIRRQRRKNRAMIAQNTPARGQRAMAKKHMVEKKSHLHKRVAGGIVAPSFTTGEHP
jgi:hypothetical protein